MPDGDKLWLTPDCFYGIIRATSETQKALMEKSKPATVSNTVQVCQRTRRWCEPGLTSRLKILPELEAEISLVVG